MSLSKPQSGQVLDKCEVSRVGTWAFEMSRFRKERPVVLSKMLGDVARFVFLSKYVCSEIKQIVFRAAWAGRMSVFGPVIL